MKEQMRAALERIAKYPMARSEEMSIETAREIARAALAAVPAQEPVNCRHAKPQCDLCAKGLYEQCRYTTQQPSEAAISAAMSEGNKLGIKSTDAARIVAAYLLAQQPAQEPVNKPEYTFDELTKLTMEAATKEGHKVTMKIKWAQPLPPVKEVTE